MRVRDTWFDGPADSAYSGASVDEKVMISEWSERSSLEQVRMRRIWMDRGIYQLSSSTLASTASSADCPLARLQRPESSSGFE